MFSTRCTNINVTLRKKAQLKLLFLYFIEKQVRTDIAVEARKAERGKR